MKVDNIVEAVRQDLLQRSQVGIKKYNTTLDRTDLSLKDWLQHAYEETLDQANYLKRAIVELEIKETQDILREQTESTLRQGLIHVSYDEKIKEGIIAKPKNIEITYDI